jgi:hypothetical protein
MMKRVLALLVLLSAVSFAGPLLNEALNEGSPTSFLETDTTSIDLSGLPMDDIEVIPLVAPPPSEAQVLSFGRAMAAAAIATPEPATYGFAAVALIAAGTFRRRKE